jgi:hypothetical protein
MLWLANIRQRKISETEFDEIQLVKWFDQSPAQGPVTRSSLRARTLVPPSFPPLPPVSIFPWLWGQYGRAITDSPTRLLLQELIDIFCSSHLFVP